MTAGSTALEIALSREADRSANISARVGVPVMTFGCTQHVVIMNILHTENIIMLNLFQHPRHNFSETPEKEVQDTSCRGSGGVPQIIKSPKIGGYRGLIGTISAVSYV